MATVETTQRHEEAAMRKVKNNLHSNNPALMFARGLESLINDPIYGPSKHDADELAKIHRRACKQGSHGNLFGALLRQFANL